jgi:hypothetical protein
MARRYYPEMPVTEIQFRRKDFIAEDRFSTIAELINKKMAGQVSRHFIDLQIFNN